MLVITVSAHSDSGSRPKIMVHYMPWYVAKPVSSYWGWHWTMNHFDPEKTDETGKREIASHYYPLIGPYDSYDPDVLEYHALLMKLAGIDGIIVDWYGIENFYDYAILNRNTARIIQFAKKAGLEFAICYEDQSIKYMANDHRIAEDDAVEHEQQAMLYLQEKWFTDNLYLRLDDRPMLLNFGPQYFTQSSQWDSLFSVLDIHPQFFTENRRLSPVATGAFPWPPMWKAQDGVLTEESCNDYLDQFYQNASDWDFVIGGAFSGFRDVYEEAGIKSSYGRLDAKMGEILIHTFQKAVTNHADIIQIVTWNDFGEGTNIEPTEEYGYRYLKIMQDLRKNIDPRFPYGNEALVLPKELYELRKRYGKNKTIVLRLDEAFGFLLSGKVEHAASLLSELER
jgi:hypothetical protein